MIFVWIFGLSDYECISKSKQLKKNKLHVTLIAKYLGCSGFSNCTEDSIAFTRTIVSCLNSTLMSCMAHHCGAEDRTKTVLPQTPIMLFTIWGSFCLHQSYVPVLVLCVQEKRLSLGTVVPVPSRSHYRYRTYSYMDLRILISYSPILFFQFWKKNRF